MNQSLREKQKPKPNDSLETKNIFNPKINVNCHILSFFPFLIIFYL